MATISEDPPPPYLGAKATQEYDKVDLEPSAPASSQATSAGRRQNQQPSAPVSPIRQFFNFNPWIFPLAYSIVTLMIFALMHLSVWINEANLAILVPIKNPKSRATSPFTGYLSVLSILSGLLLFITGYVRYRQQQYYFDCALKKFSELDSFRTTRRDNGDTFIASARAVNYVNKALRYKRFNTRLLFVCIITSQAYIWACNFRFYNLALAYSISFSVYCILMYTYSVITAQFAYFFSHKELKYESKPISFYIFAVLGFLACLYSGWALAAASWINTIPEKAPFDAAVSTFELVSNAFFPLIALCLARRMYQFTDWAKVSLF